MKIIAYTYEADTHCIGCTQTRHATNPFAKSHPDARADIVDEHGLPLTATDNEGNVIHPVFSTEEQLEPLHCGDCHQPVKIETQDSDVRVTLNPRPSEGRKFAADGKFRVVFGRRGFFGWVEVLHGKIVDWRRADGI